MNEKLESLIPTLPGWCSLAKARYLYNLIIQNNAKVVAEIGTMAARAGVALATACKETGGLYYAIDSYSFKAALEGTNNPDHDKFWMEMDYDEMKLQAEGAFREMEVQRQVCMLHKTSEEAVETFKVLAGDGYIDILYIDGNSSPEGTLLDVELYCPLIKQEGFIVLNDSSWLTKSKAKRRIVELGFVVVHEETDSGNCQWTTYKKVDSDSYKAILKAQKEREESPEHKISTLFNKMEGWMTIKKAMMIYDIIVKNKFQVSVEIGFFGMRGSVCMALAHKVVGGKHWGLDPLCVESAVEGDNDPENNDYWEKIDYEYILRSGLQVLIDEQLTQWCNILRLKSEEAFYLFSNIDVLHLDGSHSSVAAERDVQYYAPLISDEGYVIFDDSSWSQTQHAQELLVNYGFQEVHCEDAEDGTQWKIYKKIKE